MIWANWRNQFTSLETGKQGKKPNAICVDCGTRIVQTGNRKRCSACADIKLNELMRDRKKRQRQAKRLEAAR
jgi:hypothetical protein